MNLIGLHFVSCSSFLVKYSKFFLSEKKNSMSLFHFFPLPQTAGLHPTAEQIEMFAYHLPGATLSNLIVRPEGLLTALSSTLTVGIIKNSFACIYFYPFRALCGG